MSAPISHSLKKHYATHPNGQQVLFAVSLTLPSTQNRVPRPETTSAQPTAKPLQNRVAKQSTAKPLQNRVAKQSKTRDHHVTAPNGEKVLWAVSTPIFNNTRSIK